MSSSVVALYPKQEQAVDKLEHVLRSFGVALNASSTGTGKTIMSLEVARRLGLQPLVIAPLAAHATWHSWAKRMDIPLLDVINLEKLRTGSTQWITIQYPPGKQKRGSSAKCQWHLDRVGHTVIIDEVHNGCQGETTLTGKMVAYLKPAHITTQLLSATPFTTPMNMRSLGYLLGCHAYELNSFRRWCLAHGCRPNPYHKGLSFPTGTPAGDRYLGQINDAIRPYCVKLTVEDLAAEFKGNLVEPTLVQPDAAEAAQIGAIYEKLSSLAQENPTNVLTQRLVLRQQAETLKVPALAQLIADSVEEGYAVYAALGFIFSVSQLAHLLNTQHGLRAVWFTGDTKKSDREACVDAFQNEEADVLVATLAAGGASISLHQTNEHQRPRTSVLSPGESAAQLVQALGRIHRAGGLSSVVQRIVLAGGTIEERIADRLYAKTRNITSLTDSDLELT